MGQIKCHLKKIAKKFEFYSNKQVKAVRSFRNALIFRGKDKIFAFMVRLYKHKDFCGRLYRDLFFVLFECTITFSQLRLGPGYCESRSRICEILWWELPTSLTPLRPFLRTIFTASNLISFYPAWVVWTWGRVRSANIFSQNLNLSCTPPPSRVKCSRWHRLAV